MRLPRTRTAFIAGIASAAVIGASVTVYAATDATVTLTVDGEETVRDTRAATVGDLLAEAGITVDERDVVAPAVDTAVVDGLLIAVSNGKPVTWTVDGKQQELWTTAATVGEAITALGDRARNAWISVDRSQRIPVSGLAVEVRLPKRVALVTDGKARMVTTTAANVAGFLAEQKIALDRDDTVAPAPGTAIAPSGTQVTVVRVASTTTTRTVAISIPVVKRSDSSLYRGQTKVLRTGSAGKAEQTVRQIRHDGELVREIVVDTRVITAASPKVIAVGTKARPGTYGTVSGVAGLNWAALARCESGGNPRAINPAGYYGLYQFALSTWRSVGGSGNPIDASSSEQTYRAQLLYKRAGGAGPWPHCGRLLYT